MVVAAIDMVSARVATPDNTGDSVGSTADPVEAADEAGSHPDFHQGDSGVGKARANDRPVRSPRAELPPV